MHLQGNTSVQDESGDSKWCEDLAGSPKGNWGRKRPLRRKKVHPKDFGAFGGDAVVNRSEAFEMGVKMFDYNIK